MVGSVALPPGATNGNAVSHAPTNPVHAALVGPKIQRPSNPLLDLSHIRHMFAGLSGGVISTLFLHPLDLMKIRFAVSDGKGGDRDNYTSLRSAFRSISERYGFRGFYQGVVPNCVGAGISWGVYFFYYNARKKSMIANNENHVIGPVDHMLAAAESGIASLVASNPVWVVKTRMCLQLEDIVMPEHKKYKNMTDAFIKIYKYEGVLGFYKGFTPGIAGVAHGSIQFMAYEELKRRVSAKYNNRPLTTAEYLGCAALSKVFAASITYPYQVVRARLQDQYKDWGTIRVIVKNTIKYEGFRGFYKGLVPYLLHVMPNICIVFITYELLVNKMNDPSAGSAAPAKTLPVAASSPSSAAAVAPPPPSLPTVPPAKPASTFYNNSPMPSVRDGQASVVPAASITSPMASSRTPTTKDIAVFQTSFPREQSDGQRQFSPRNVASAGASSSVEPAESELLMETPVLLLEDAET